MSQERFTLPSFAKINLTLRVLGRRPDGYHELQTIFQTVSLRDRLTFGPLAGGRLELVCDDPGVPADESNLVVRAARALRERFGVRRGARVVLEKRIPAGGGLGGGSSNAAVALLGLARLWELETGVAELAEIGARLGADVPFFLTGGTALGAGTGTQITPLEDAAPLALLVVTPGVRVSTSDAYKALSAPALTKAGAAVMLPISRAELQIKDSLCAVMRNDFEPVVLRLYPEIGRAKDALLGRGARRALLSGSGSSVFGIFDREEESGRAAAALGGEAAWRVVACSTMRRAEYRAALGCGAEILPRGHEA